MFYFLQDSFFLAFNQWVLCFLQSSPILRFSNCLYRFVRTSRRKIKDTNEKVLSLLFIKKSLKLLTWKKYYHNFSAFEKFSLLLDSLFFASRVCFQFPLQEKMFEPNMLLAAMNNADSNNHNYNHEDNNNEGFLRDDEFDSANTKSGSENQEGGSGNDQDPLHPNKKKRYHRHTQLQIQEMEAYAFKLLTCFNFFFFFDNFCFGCLIDSSKSVLTQMTSKGNN